jgi:hypothetical protein
VVLQQIFTGAVTTAATLASALKGASITISDAAVAVRTLFPSITAVQLAAVLVQVYQP